MPKNTNPHLLIVEARFYDDLADALLDGAKAALDEEAVPAIGRRAFDQPVPVLAAECRNVDDGQRVGGFQP